MLGAIGSNLMSLLRLLTPHEVTTLTHEAEAKDRFNAQIGVSVGLDLSDETKREDLFQDNLSKKETSKEAKILPFNQEHQLALGSQETQASTVVKKLTRKQKEELLLRSLNIKKKKKRVVGGEDFDEDYDDEDRPKKRNPEDDMSSTVFLISEKAKIKQSQMKLTEQEAIKSYRTQAAIDTSHEDKEDLTQSSSSGILVNKRQF